MWVGKMEVLCSKNVQSIKKTTNKSKAYGYMHVSDIMKTFCEFIVLLPPFFASLGGTRTKKMKQFLKSFLHFFLTYALEVVSDYDQKACFHFEF